MGGGVGTGGNFEEFSTSFDAKAHQRDVREGYGFGKDTPDSFDTLMQLDRDINEATAQRLATIIGRAIDLYPSIDITAEESRARLQVVDELAIWHEAQQKNEGTYHDSI